MILGYLRINSGVHFKVLLRDLQYGNGTLVYHLSVLEKMNLIKSNRDGRFKRFYLKNQKIPEYEGKKREIIQLLKRIPDLNTEQISQYLKVHKNTAKKYLKDLEINGIIQSKNAPGGDRYALSPKRKV